MHGFIVIINFEVQYIISDLTDLNIFAWKIIVLSKREFRFN